MLYDEGRLRKSRVHAAAGQEDQLSLVTLPTYIIQQIEVHGFDIICMNDMSGKIEYISESVQGMLGFSKQDLLERSVFRYIMFEDQRFIQSHLDLHAFPKEGQRYTVNIRNQSGRFIIFDMILYVFQLENKIKMLSILKNVTDKKQAEEVLIRSEKMSVAGQLAAGIAHEIRNPLTSLKGFTQLLQSGISNKEEYYQIMMDEIDKIIAITSELLFISKPMTNERDDQSVNAMLQDVITLLRTEANLYDIDIVIEQEEDIVVVCDCSQIKQVLINLIKNAIEEMKDGGLIHICVQQTETDCIISIRDQGQGISSHLIDKLKEPFFTTKKQGTGLGLMICQQIMDNHNGKIEIESTAGEGSTFHIYLPL